MKEPLVSIIMPVYNVEKYITKSLESVIRQTYKNVELILVDDGSKDQSRKIAEEYLKCHSYKYKLLVQENAGQGMARNKGLKYASGEWVYFLDSDDIILPYAMEHLLEAAKEKRVDFVFSGFRRIRSLSGIWEERGKGNVQYYTARQLQYAFLMRTQVILAPGTLYRKNFLYENKLFFEQIPWSEDQYFVWRVLHDMKIAAYVEENLYLYLQHGGSIMSATKSAKMAESYPKIQQLNVYYGRTAEIGKYIVSRWMMGTANSAAAIMGYGEWKRLISQMEYRKNFRCLLTFPDKKIAVAAGIGRYIPRVYYALMRKKAAQADEREH